MFTSGGRSILCSRAVTDGLSGSNLHVLIVKTNHHRGRSARLHRRTSNTRAASKTTSRCVIDVRSSPTRCSWDVRGGGWGGLEEDPVLCSPTPHPHPYPRSTLAPFPRPFFEVGRRRRTKRLRGLFRVK